MRPSCESVASSTGATLQPEMVGLLHPELTMANFILRKFDDTLWSRVKTRAASEGRSLRWIVLKLLEMYADGLKLK